MERKKFFVVFLAMVLVIFFVVTNSTLAWNPFKSPAEKAEVLIQKAVQLREMDMGTQAEMKLQKARKILIKALEKDTGDLDALFALAKCEYYQGNRRAAERKFRIVYLKNRQKFGPKIFEFYRAESKRHMEIGRLKESLDLVVKSYDFQPNKARRDKAAEELFRVGSTHLFSGAISTAQLYYQACIRLNSAYKPVIAQAFISGATKNRFNPSHKIYLLHLGLQYSSPDQKQEIIKTLKVIGQEFRKKKIQQRQVRQELNRLPQEFRVVLVNIAWPPDYKIYHPGDVFYFKGKAGEYSDHWINPVYGTRSRFQVKEGEFAVVTRSGKRFKMGHYPKYLTEDYKIYAVTDCDMRILFE